MPQIDKLIECEYCGGLRVYEAGKSCPGCGAPLPRPKAKKTLSGHPFPNPYRPMSNYQEQMMGMQAGAQSPGWQHAQMMDSLNRAYDYSHGEGGYFGTFPLRGKGGW